MRSPCYVQFWLKPVEAETIPAGLKKYLSLGDD